MESYTERRTQIVIAIALRLTYCFIVLYGPFYMVYRVGILSPTIGSFY